MMSFAGSASFQVVLEAALRALLLATVLWSALRLFRVRHTPVQKAAWTMVLAAAIAMPLLISLQWHPAWAAVNLPAVNFPALNVPTVQPPAVNLSRLQRPQRQENAAQPASAAAAGSAMVLDDAKSAGSGWTREDEQSPPSDFSIDSSDAYQARTNSASQRVPPVASATHTISPSILMISGSTLTISRLTLISIAWIVYLGVCAVLVGRLLFGFASSLRLWLRSEPVNSSMDPETLRGIAVRWSTRIASPANIGSGILLPADYVNWDREKLRVVLAHEQAHVRQRDFYLQLFAGFYAALTWFSPMGWWLKRKLSELGEAISDHAGLEVADSPASYAELLLEFAARPRPSFAEVAMAHSTNLPQRIERLLNESSFRKTFAGGRRALAALLLPAIFIAAAAVVHVEAASAPTQTNSTQTNSLQTSSTQSSTLGTQTSAAVQSKSSAASASQSDAGANASADSSEGSGQASQTAAPDPRPVPSPSDSAQPEPVAAPAPPKSPAPAALPAPHALIHADNTLHVHLELNDSGQVLVHLAPQLHVAAVTSRNINIEPRLREALIDPIQLVVPPVQVDIDDHGDFEGYALVGDPGTEAVYSGGSRGQLREEIEKARAQAHGHFLLFRRDGKLYIIDDPAIVKLLEDDQKSLNDLRDQMHAMGQQMRDYGEQMREESRKEREAAANIPTPDLSKEMAELNAAVAALQGAQGGTISREQLNELQRKLGEVQRRLISVQVKADVNNGEAMRKLGEQQGKFGGEMGRLGGEMGSKARQNHEKVRSVIDESLKNGKARPVN
jgi:beta-lactamase regulating signal transducer with metallopeptidase domain